MKFEFSIYTIVFDVPLMTYFFVLFLFYFRYIFCYIFIFQFGKMASCFATACDVLRDLVPFVQFIKREKHPWGSVTFSKTD